MDQTPSSDADNSHLAGQEIPRRLWNPKVHFRVCKGSPLDLITSHMNLVHNCVAYFLKIHFDVILIIVTFRPSCGLVCVKVKPTANGM
jgi:hypothetical protein